jgi:hypothetical protein
VEKFKVTQPYDLLLSEIKSFYDLDNCSVIQGSRSNVYLLDRSPRDYQFMVNLFKPETANYNISKIKQMSSLYDLLHHVDTEYSTISNKQLRIEIYDVSDTNDRGLVQVSFGNVLYFSIEKKAKTTPEDIYFSSLFLKDSSRIDNKKFEAHYSELLEKLALFIDKDMTMQEFNDRDKKTLDEIRTENLSNKDLIYCSKADCATYFHSFSRPPEDFFVPLTRAFSKNLMQQVKTIEALLRFESNLKHNRSVYELVFNTNLSNYKFILPNLLYSIVFEYEQDLNLSVTLYFQFKTDVLRYLEIDHHTHEKVDILGYEAIYNYISNRIKTFITANLGVSQEEITNESILLYRMMAI